MTPARLALLRAVFAVNDPFVDVVGKPSRARARNNVQWLIDNGYIRLRKRYWVTALGRKTIKANT